MLKKVLNYFYSGIQKIFRFLNQIRLFLLPNLYQILKGRLICENNYPTCYQRIYIRGNGIVRIKSNCIMGYKMGGFHYGGSIELQARYESAVIEMGSNVLTNNNIFICAASKISIGDNTLIGQFVTIMDHEAHGIDPQKRRQIGEIGEVSIGKNVWIGNNVVILKNSFLGDNCIVAAGAIVSGTFPANVIIGGVPAKVIKVI